MSELILAGSSGKTTLSEMVQANGGFPATASDPVTSQSSKWVSGVTYIMGANSTTGTIIAVASAAESKIAGKGVQFAGMAQPNGQVTWTCTAAPAGAVASLTATIPLEDRYLPASCK
ncbi:MAG: pilin [Rhodoferax sp.]|nr:pilin [Rhodoferax sp.]